MKYNNDTDLSAIHTFYFILLLLNLIFVLISIILSASPSADVCPFLPRTFYFSSLFPPAYSVFSKWDHFLGPWSVGIIVYTWFPCLIFYLQLCYLYADLYKQTNSKETRRIFMDIFTSFIDRGAVSKTRHHTRVLKVHPCCQSWIGNVWTGTWLFS